MSTVENNKCRHNNANTRNERNNHIMEETIVKTTTILIAIMRSSKGYLTVTWLGHCPRKSDPKPSRCVGDEGVHGPFRACNACPSSGLWLAGNEGLNPHRSPQKNPLIVVSIFFSIPSFAGNQRPV